MKQKSTIVLILLTLVWAVTASTTRAQSNSDLRLAKISPYDRVVPGEIIQLLVQGIGSDSPVGMLTADDFQVEVSQDGVNQEIKARLVNPLMMTEPARVSHPGEMPPEAITNGMQVYQSVSFVVPQGVHTGDAEVAVAYRGQRSNPLKLVVIERPLRPAIATVAVETMNPSSLPPPGTLTKNIGWRLERGSKAQFRVTPLVDPDAANAGVLVRFRQGNVVLDAPAHVVHQDRMTEKHGRGAVYMNARDYLEVEVPAALEMGEAEVEVRLRANGQTSDPATAKVTITESSRAAEAPAENAPRVLAVAPRKVGAGQSLVLSIDRLRTLEPDPEKTVVVFEHEGVKYSVAPEKNSASLKSNRPLDGPVSLIVRPTAQLLGDVEVRVLNPSRGEQGGLSAATTIEVVQEAQPPELKTVGEATAAELAPLTQMYEAQRSAGHPFPGYDPGRHYLAIRASGIDLNPRNVRIRVEQSGHSETLAPNDFALYASGVLIVRLPQGLSKGPTSVSIENRGANGYSHPVTGEFELSGPS